MVKKMFRNRAVVSPTAASNDNNIPDGNKPALLQHEDDSIRSVDQFGRTTPKEQQRHYRENPTYSTEGTDTAAVESAVGSNFRMADSHDIQRIPEDCPPQQSLLLQKMGSTGTAPSCAATTEGSLSTNDNGSIDSSTTFGSSPGGLLLRTASHASRASYPPGGHPPPHNPAPSQEEVPEAKYGPPQGGEEGEGVGSVLYRMPAAVPEQEGQEHPPTSAPAAGEDTAAAAAHPSDFNLSLRDMFTTEEALDSQAEYFQDNNDDQYDEESQNKGKNLNNATPPTSLNTTPTDLFSKPGDLGSIDGAQMLPSIASSNASHQSSAAGTPTAGSLAYSGTNKPVLYSAIGSLEDPSSSSYKGWKNRQAAAKKFEFPSTQQLIPPPKMLANRPKNNPKNNSTFSSSLLSGALTNQKNFATQRDYTNSAESLLSGALVNQNKAAPKGEEGAVDGSAPPKKPPSSLRKGKLSKGSDPSKDPSTESVATSDKKVTIAKDAAKPRNKSSRKAKPKEMFRPSSDAYTPRMGKKEIKYKPAEMRTPVQHMASPLGTLSRPNFRDALRRVAMIIHQHIVKIERRFENAAHTKNDGLFSKSMKEEFAEEKFLIPRYKCSMVRLPMSRSAMVCGMKRIREKYEIPTEAEIYEFAHRLFKTVHLSSECSIVCLIYVERLMEASKVPLLAKTWRPIFMCGLLLASKVWQDLSSWNIEFASVYPQYSLESINRLEVQFLRMIKWDLYISSSQYAKYFFALRSLVEKTDFRQRYNRMVGGVDTVASEKARQIEQRSSMVKEEAISQLSRSM